MAEETRVPVLMSLSGPDLVRIELQVDGDRIWVEGTAMNAIQNAWCILDSAESALIKAKKPVPEALRRAMGLLRGMHGS